MPLATGTVLAALGAKAASAVVDPSIFLSTGAAPLGKAAGAVVDPSLFLSTGTAAPLGKGLGATLISLKAGKTAAVSAPTAASFLSHGAHTAADTAATGGTSFLASKGGAAAALGGKGAGSVFFAKGSGGGAVGTSLAKVGSGVGAAKPSFLKVAQKSCFAKRRMRGLGKAKGAGKGAKGAAKAAKKAKKRAKKAAKRAKDKAKKEGDGSTKEGESTSSSSGSSSSGSSSSGSSSSGSSSSGSSSSTGEGSSAGGGSSPPPDAGAGAPIAQPTGAEAPSAPVGGTETLPASLSTPSPSTGVSGAPGFVQIHASGNSPVTTGATTGTTSTVVHSSAGHATSAASGAAAAAADQATDAATQGPQWMGPPSSGAEAASPGAAGLDDDGAFEDVGASPSRGKKMLSGFMRGALGMDEEEEGGSVLGELSRCAGSRMFGGILGSGHGSTAAAMAGALGGLGGLHAGAIPAASEALDPGMVPTEGVEEETMAAAALLPSLFMRLSFASSRKGGGAGKGRGRTPHQQTQKAVCRRRPSAASTACSSDSGCPSDCSFSGPPSTRRVIRADADGRKATYADFLC